MNLTTTTKLPPHDTTMKYLLFECWREMKGLIDAEMSPPKPVGL